MTEEELLPCPFCGDTLELRGGVNPYGRHANKESRCIMAATAISIPYDVERWNRRTPPARSIDAGDGYVLVPREPTEAMKTAGMDVLMYRIETITPSDLWRAMLAAAPSPPPAKKVGPTTNAAAFELSIYEGVRDRLARLTAGTCSCNTKSPELRYHSERCHYRVAREALDLLLAAPPPPAKEAE